MSENIPVPSGEFLLYQTEDGHTRVECRFTNETLWLPQAGMAELFQTTPQNITLHLKALYAEGEISMAATCKDYLQVRSEGERQVHRAVKYYSLEAILPWTIACVLCAACSFVVGRQSASVPAQGFHHGRRAA